MNRPAESAFRLVLLTAPELPNERPSVLTVVLTDRGDRAPVFRLLPGGATGPRPLPEPVLLRPREPAPPAADREHPGDLAPLFLPGAEIDAAGERWLTGQALAALRGEPGAFATLHRAVEPRLRAWTWQRALRSPTSGPLRDGQRWLLEDLNQESWIVLRETLESWPGGDSFLPWFLMVTPRRLNTAWRMLAPPTRWAAARERAVHDPALTGVEDSELARQCLALLEPDDARLLGGWLAGETAFQAVRTGLQLGRGATRWRMQRIARVLQPVLLAWRTGDSPMRPADEPGQGDHDRDTDTSTTVDPP